MSAGEGGLHTRYGQVFYGVTYPDQRFLGAEKGSTCEQDTCSRRVDLAYAFGCPTLAFYRILPFIHDAALCTKCVYCSERTDKMNFHNS